MENSTSTTKQKLIKAIAILVFIAMVVAAGFYYWQWSQRNRSEKMRMTAPMSLELTETPFVDGVLNAPEGFPSSIPLERDSIVTSTLTNFPDRGATQRSVMYHSKESVEAKRAEYSAYLETNDYTVEQISREDGTIFFSGQKEGETLSIVITIWEEFTRVYVTHVSLSN